MSCVGPQRGGPVVVWGQERPAQAPSNGSSSSSLSSASPGATASLAGAGSAAPSAPALRSRRSARADWRRSRPRRPGRASWPCFVAGGAGRPSSPPARRHERAAAEGRPPSSPRAPCRQRAGPRPLQAAAPSPRSRSMLAMLPSATGGRRQPRPPAALLPGGEDPLPVRAARGPPARIATVAPRRRSAAELPASASEDEAHELSHVHGGRQGRATPDPPKSRHARRGTRRSSPRP